MQPKALEIQEPVVIALVDAVTAWQVALEQTLGVSGLTYPKWLLLRAISHGRFTRGQPCESAIFLDVPQTERLLRELHNDDWIEFATEGAPAIAHAAEPRLARAAQAVRALRSVSVGHFSGEERAMLGSLLHRMTATLNDHVERHRRHDAWEPHQQSVRVPDDISRAARRAMAA